MKNGESSLTKDQRIINRSFILSNLDDIIKESIYYRTNAENFTQSPAAKININTETRAKLI